MNDETELARQAMTIDPTRSNIVLLLGMKGRGKSTAARMLFDAWPADRVVIDPTGNARPDDPDTIALAPPFPSQIPERTDDKGNLLRSTVWARVHPGSPTLAHDENQAVNMALHPRRKPKLLWRDEYGLQSSPNASQKGKEADRTLLMSSRHYNITALLVVQRPRYIPVLALSQADIVGVWALPNGDDRELVAKNAGIPVPVFERAYQANQRRGRHAFLLFNREQDVLLECPPLPGVTARGPKS